MTPEEEAYAEALRRIREAEDSGALELDLSGLKEGESGAQESTELETLNQLPPELAGLTSHSVRIMCGRYRRTTSEENWLAVITFRSQKRRIYRSVTISR